MPSPSPSPSSSSSPPLHHHHHHEDEEDTASSSASGLTNVLSPSPSSAAAATHRPRHEVTALMQQLNSYEKPSVHVAHQWLEQVILPRRRVDPKTKTYRMLEMGEPVDGSELFPVWKTSLNDLTEFGIGIGLYFRMLLQLSLLLLVLAAVSIPSVAYFLSEDYSGPLAARNIPWKVYGSAVCTQNTSLPTSLTVDGYPTNANNNTNTNAVTSLASSNTGAAILSEENQVDHVCPLVLTQFHVDMIVLVILWLYLIVAGVLQDKYRAQIDQQEQTAQDYAVQIKDPDPDAWDPDEWHRHFSQFGPVKFVTVAVDNRKLLEALDTRRYMQEMLKMECRDQRYAQQLVPFHHDDPVEAATMRAASVQTLTRLVRKQLQVIQIHGCKRLCQSLGFLRDADYWHNQLVQQQQVIDQLLDQESFRVLSVFIMFETELAQRNCLAQTRVGLCAAVLDAKLFTVPEHVRFRGTNVLEVIEPVEPTSVKWNALGVGKLRRLGQQLVTTTIVLALMVFVVVFVFGLKRWINRQNPTANGKTKRKYLYLIAYSITILEYMCCRVIGQLNRLEIHQTREREQLSRLNKLLVFRAFSSALLIYWLTDFQQTLQPKNIQQIQAIIFANMTTTPLLQLISLYDRVLQWVYGCTAKTQRKLNAAYSGTWWQLAERYTEITKTVWVALFFKPIFPLGMLLTSLSLVVNYWVDKYCLLRKWKVPPKFDGMLARASRLHLIILGLVSLVMMGHWYTDWPFDAISQQYHDQRMYSHTSLQRLVRLVFPMPHKGMPPTQTHIIETLRLVIILLTLVVLAGLVAMGMYTLLKNLVFGRHYELDVTKLSPIGCSDVQEMTTYVPQMDSRFEMLSDFPLVTVRLNAFENEYIDWTGDHEANCLVNDVLALPRYVQLAKEEQDAAMDKLFGVCKQYDSRLPSKVLESHMEAV